MILWRTPETMEETNPQFTWLCGIEGQGPSKTPAYLMPPITNLALLDMPDRRFSPSPLSLLVAHLNTLPLQWDRPLN
ncbi:hypothetical protein J6590_034840 [Homalodisca vitripennis]|nr:hypothetical protein J6590_034840 [Homalodisca vitripennis]